MKKILYIVSLTTSLLCISDMHTSDDNNYITTTIVTRSSDTGVATKATIQGKIERSNSFIQTNDAESYIIDPVSQEVIKTKLSVKADKSYDVGIASLLRQQKSNKDK